MVSSTTTIGMHHATALNYSHAAPEGYKAYGAVCAYLRQCGLPETLINLVYLRVSQINGCACIDMHSARTCSSRA